jgi:hypothetical protein
MENNKSSDCCLTPNERFSAISFSCMQRLSISKLFNGFVLLNLEFSVECFVDHWTSLDTSTCNVTCSHHDIAENLSFGVKQQSLDLLFPLYRVVEANLE